VKDIKLLSPAGSQEALQAALEHGADAVYLGGKRFGARKYASNFDDLEMKEALRLAHLSDAEVFVTVNTLANQGELPHMIKYMADLYSWGVDAVIVQDIGAAALARRHLPDLPVHASTQMTIHNRPQVEWAEAMGLSAVVLAREVPLYSIKNMFEGYRVKPEVFVHGALCYGYSGQCLFSHIHQERSANKGACAQPCRRAYKLVKEVNKRRITVPTRGKYPLCMRDLCTIEEMGNIVDSGVKVLKIEGRMKGEQYVKTTTSIYRKYLDQALKGEFKTVDRRDNDLLWLAYNREFTKGYLFYERFAKVKSRLRPDNRGLLIGNIINVNNTKETMTIRPQTDIVPNPRDVIKVVTDYDYRLKNLNLHVKHIKRDTGGNLEMNSHKDAEKGDNVYLATHEIGSYLAPVKRGVAVNVQVVLKKGQPIRMEATGGGVDVKVTGSQVISKAKTSPLTKEGVTKQIIKTGPHIVNVKDIKISMEDDCFLTISELNAVRRELYQKAESQWLRTRFPLPKKVRFDAKRVFEGGPRRKGKTGGGKPRVLVITHDARDLPWLKEAKLEAIYLDCLYGLNRPKYFERALGLVQEYGGKDLFIKTPRITMQPSLKDLGRFLKELKGKEFMGFRAGNWGAYRTIRETYPDKPVHGDVSFNITNFVSANMLLDDMSGITLSPELEPDEMASLAYRTADPGRLQVLAGGKHSIMITRDCMLGSSVHDASMGPKGFDDVRCKKVCGQGDWYLKDYKKRHYPLWFDPDCFGHVFNHKVLETDFSKLRKAGISSFVLDLRGFPVYERRDVLQGFREQVKGGK